MKRISKTSIFLALLAALCAIRVWILYRRSEYRSIFPWKQTGPWANNEIVTGPGPSMKAEPGVALPSDAADLQEAPRATEPSSTGSQPSDVSWKEPERISQELQTPAMEGQPEPHEAASAVPSGEEEPAPTGEQSQEMDEPTTGRSGNAQQVDAIEQQFTIEVIAPDASMRARLSADEEVEPFEQTTAASQSEPQIEFVRAPADEEKQSAHVMITSEGPPAHTVTEQAETQTTTPEAETFTDSQETVPDQLGATESVYASEGAAPFTSEQVQLPEASSGQSARKSHRRMPQDSIPGRRHAEAVIPEIETVEKAASRYPKPELVCWQRRGQWYLGVDIPEELDHSGLNVWQNASQLEQDQFDTRRWQLHDLSGKIIAHWRIEDRDTIAEEGLDLGDARLLVFKLSSRRQSEGRRVKAPTSGSYLVIAPDSWERDGDLAGPPPVLPEPVFLRGYKAHFFDLERDESPRIAFRDELGKQILIESENVRFDLIGCELKDAEENRGPLFGEHPPQIRIWGDRLWQEVKTVVVGEEGKKGEWWRQKFSPDKTIANQCLPSDLEGQAGWYYLRFYDLNGDLMDSLDFRFAAGLKGIDIESSEPLADDRHREAVVEFRHLPGYEVRPAESLAGALNIQHETDKTLVRVPPDSRFDITRWVIHGPNDQFVNVTIRIDRVWWGLGDEDRPPTEWTDRILPLTRSDFAAISPAVLWIRLAASRWAESVSAGFSGRQRTFQPSVNENLVAIPLRDFGDAEALCKAGTSAFCLSVASGGKTGTTSIGKLRIECRCKKCDFSSVSDQEVLNHISSAHLALFFKQLTYDELANRDPNLPRAIYQCSHCERYFRDDEGNAATSIYAHIQHDCEKVRRGAGPVEVCYRVIKDANEVRRNVIRNLLDVYKCAVCGTGLEHPTAKTKLDHLIDKHRGMIYELR